jgi:hypothetical protein
VKWVSDRAVANQRLLLSLDQGPIGRTHETCENSPVFGTRKTEKLRKNHVMTKSTPTLTQSGMLAVLLQRQRYKVIQLAQRRAHRKQMRAALWNTLTWPYRALTAPRLVDDSAEPFVGNRPAPHLNLSLGQ